MTKTKEFKNLQDFILYILEKKSIVDILDDFDTQSEKGYVYERLWDLIIKFGYCSTFLNSKYKHVISNVNNGIIKFINSIKEYLLTNKVQSGNSGGCSDITLYDEINNKYIFITSKYPKNQDDSDNIKNKSVDYYDIQNIIAVIDKNKHIYKNYEIYLLVPSKNKVLKAVEKSNTSSNYLTEYMVENKILDKKDLEKYFQEFKKDIIKYNINEYDKIYMSKKDKLIMRFHQKLINKKTSILIEEGEKQFGFFCKCRSGKTFIVGNQILEEKSKKNILNVLIITPCPTETSPQFTDELFNSFIDFENFKIYGLKNTKIINKLIENNEVDKNNSNIFVISKPLLQNFIENKIEFIKNLDLLICDEGHFTLTTSKSSSILKAYSSKNTVKIYLTATYNKPLHKWDIPEECQMFWDIEDEQECKKIYKTFELNVNNNYKDDVNIKNLIDKHGNIVNDIIHEYIQDGYTISEIFKPYMSMPDLYLLTSLFDQQRYDIIKNKIADSKYGFSFDSLFSLNKNKTKFNYEEDVQTFLRYISGSNKEVDFKNGDKSIMSRIKNICSTKDSRLPFTQIWFLPPNNINETSKVLHQVMMNDNIFNKYDIFEINSIKDTKDDDNKKKKINMKIIKDEINKMEIEAKENNKKGLILLVGNMLTLGITLNKCDIVMLFNNTLSGDKMMQQMYRCMTEGNNKKMGFVVDLNISRVLNTCINYSVHNKNLSIDNKIKYLIENHLINIDIDLFDNKKLNSDKLINKLLELWKSDPINAFKTLLKNLDDDYIAFDNETQKLLNKSFTSSIKDKISATLEIKDDGDQLQDMQSGVDRIKISETDNDTEKTIEKEKEIEEIEISFSKDVLPHIIPLACILTIGDSNKDFVKMLSDIQENPELLEVFNEQSKVWWNKNNLINLIKNTVNKFINKNSNTFNITVSIKMSIKSLIDNPKDLLELINECLKPKDIEKKKFGEVFTPMDFINNKMLKDIEDYWLITYKEIIWTNDKIKYYDPATGMGNYPIAIYYKLLEGLKIKIPDEELRKKHIIENMLYMGELNKKNCFIIKQIFNIDNKYKLNLYEGNTLEVDIKKTFGIDKFDIIIGNPPYNEELTSVGAKPLYNKFVEYYVDKCKMLSFITPSRWFAGGKGLDGFRKMMINRTDIIYIKHYEKASEIFGNTVSIEGGVNYFLIDEKYNGLCDYNGSKVQFNNFDIVLDGKYYEIINKILNYDKITKYYISQDYYKIQTNDKRLKNIKTNDDIKCYVSQQKGFNKYINKNEIIKPTNNYKVITARANGGNGCFGNIFIGSPDEVHTKSYISFNLNSENEAKSLLSYMKCKLPNFMLSLRKISQDISESTCKWIPLPPLNKEWNDEEVYKHFKLSENEIKLIKETTISGYKDIKTVNTEVIEEKKPKKLLKNIIENTQVIEEKKPKKIIKKKIKNNDV